MNATKCKELRKALTIKKPTPSIGGYNYFDVQTWEWSFVRRINPTLNLYRRIKRHYKRGY